MDCRLDGFGVRVGQMTSRLDIGSSFADRGLQGDVGSQEILGLVVGNRAGEGVDGIIEASQLTAKRVDVSFDVGNRPLLLEGLGQGEAEEADDGNLGELHDC